MNPILIKNKQAVRISTSLWVRLKFRNYSQSLAMTGGIQVS